MYPKQLNLHDCPSSALKTMKNEKDQNVEIKEVNMIDKREREREEEEEEERKIDTFFKLIKTYQEARKRRREELTRNSGESRKKWNGGERSCVVVPAFLPEDFSECRMDLKPVLVVADHKEDDGKVKEEEEEVVEKEGQEEKGLDLNLAL
ncbi:protein NIM1-INTERACTING 1 [Raphanus sativus]|uniref:Protein NIM1-INTERACTING 1 n=1 Tax=Raphanus sativus TaxID=3726 RepID=A0A6J0NXY5_RAPSA|nr:protein NIM1-INTERACTING 1 [Raphanus sativus]